jgi:hypothetical protein
MHNWDYMGWLGQVKSFLLRCTKAAAPARGFSNKKRLQVATKTSIFSEINEMAGLVPSVK